MAVMKGSLTVLSMVEMRAVQLAVEKAVEMVASTVA